MQAEDVAASDSNMKFQTDDSLMSLIPLLALELISLP